MSLCVALESDWINKSSESRRYTCAHSLIINLSPSKPCLCGWGRGSSICPCRRSAVRTRGTRAAGGGAIERGRCGPPGRRIGKGNVRRQISESSRILSDLSVQSHKFLLESSTFNWGNCSPSLGISCFAKPMSHLFLFLDMLCEEVRPETVPKMSYSSYWGAYFFKVFNQISYIFGNAAPFDKQPSTAQTYSNPSCPPRRHIGARSMIPSHLGCTDNFQMICYGCESNLHCILWVYL